MKLAAFSAVLERAVQLGLHAAVLFDRDGDTVGIAGDITEEEARPLAAMVMYRLRSEDLAARLFTGEVLVLPVEERDVAVAVARRQLFLVVKLAADLPDGIAQIRELLELVEGMLPDPTIVPSPWIRSPGGSGSGPAELPVIELGITVPRPRAKA